MVVNQDLVTDELVEERFADATAPGAQEAMRSMGMSFWNPETAEDGMLWREAHRLRKHTLLTWGREDRVNPLDGALAALKLIPKATLHVFPNCGHWAQIEAADEFAEIATAFLARHVERQADAGAHDDRHQVHGLRPGRQHRPRAVEAASPARCSASPRAAARTRTTTTGGSTRSPPGSSSSPPTSTSSTPPAGRSPTTRPSRRPASTCRRPASSSRRARTEELAERRVQELVRFCDPWDNVFELFHGITYESRPVVTPYAATFVTGDQGMGHIVLPVARRRRGAARSTPRCSASGCATR